MHIFHNGIGKPVQGLGGGGQGFAPTDIGALALWLDAADSNTITQVDGNVSQWDDKSGQANHVTQGLAASQPLTGTRSQNGMNVLDFDGGDYLKNDVFGPFVQPSTIIVVAAQDNTNNTWYVDGGSTGGGSQRNAIGGDYGAYKIYGGAILNTGVAIDTAAHIRVGIFNGTSSKAYIDGGSGVTGDAGTQGISGFVVGARATRADSFVDGWIGEVVIYNALLSNEEINQYGNYAAEKWGLSWTNI